MNNKINSVAESNSTEYRTYTSDLFEQQYVFVTEITRHWEGYFHPTRERIKSIYNSDSFTPETRHFAFDRSRIVGFINSSMEKEVDNIKHGSIQLPFIEEEKVEIEEFLMEKAIKTLVGKHVEIISTYIPDNWQYGSDFAKRYDFVSTNEVMMKISKIDLQKYDFTNFERPEWLVDVDPVGDKEDLIKVFLSELPDEKIISKVIDTWKTATHIITNVIVKDDIGIVAHAMIIKSDDDKSAIMPHISIYREGKENLREIIFKHLITKMQESTTAELNFHLYSENFSATSDYESYGVVFRDIIRYVINFIDDDYDNVYIPHDANRLFII